MQENNTYEQEIDLKDLLISVLRKWRPIMIVAVLLAIILGGFKALSSIKAQNDPVAIAEVQDEYQSAQDVYTNTLATYEREIKNIMDDIEAQTEYSENSVLMKISPYDKFESSADIFVKTDYSIMPGMVYQNLDYTNSILSAYASFLRQGGAVEKIADDMDIEVRYIEELINIDNDLNNRILHINVTYSDQKNADKILNTLLDELEDYSKEVIDSIGNHTISVVSKSSGSVVDLALSATQTSNRNNIASMQDALVAKKAALKELKEPVEPDSSKLSALKTGIKYAFLGGVLGGFMMVFFFCVGFLMSNKVSSSKDLRGRFSLKILGQFQEIREKKLFGSVDRMIDKMDGINRQVSNEMICEVIAANIKNYSQQNKRLMITGTVESDILSHTVEMLAAKLSSYDLVIAGNININASSLEALPDCDAVILVEQKGVSSISSIAEEVETIKNLNKELVGCILY